MNYGQAYSNFLIMNSFTIYYDYVNVLFLFLNFISFIQPSLSEFNDFADPPRTPLIRATELRETSLIIKWDRIGNPEDVNFYALFFREENSPWSQIVFPAPERNEYELTNLKRATWYAIYLKSEGMKGSSQPSKVVTVKTLGESSDFPIRDYPERSIFGSDDRRVPPYLSSFFVIPISLAIIVVVIVCAASYVYIKKEENKAALIRAGYIPQSPSKNFQYISGQSTPSRQQSIVSEESSLTLRYSDNSDRGKPLMARPPLSNSLWAQQQGPIAEENEDFPSPYGTLPIHQGSKFHSSPPPPPRNPPPILKSFTPSFKSSNSTNNFQPESETSPNLNSNFSPQNNSSQHAASTAHTQQASSSVFCKADVHFDDSSTPAYDFFNYHRV